MKRCIIATVAMLTLAPAVSAQNASLLDPITAIASRSTCNPQGHDRAPAAYIRGMAMTFARAVCHPERADVRVSSAARAAPGSEAALGDALTVFDEQFRRLNMSNDSDGPDALRHTYVLLLGLGLIESSGKYCAGRDSPRPYNHENSAESGLFQTSWGAHTYSDTLEPLYNAYKPSRPLSDPDPGKCLLNYFKQQGLSCRATDATNWGKRDSVGYYWQDLTKKCPAFAVEYAAVVLRKHGGGGEYGEFGPIKCFIRNDPRCRKPTIYPACDTMFSQVQTYVSDHPEVCTALP